MIVAAPRRRAATTAAATEHRPPTRRRTATTAAATEHCPPSNFNWDIIGMATATEHNQIADGQLVTDAEHNHWTRNVTFSIGSIKIRTDVSNAHTRRVLLILEQEVHSIIHNEISEDELVQISCATEQKYSCIPDWHYQKKKLVWHHRSHITIRGGLSSSRRKFREQRTPRHFRQVKETCTGTAGEMCGKPTLPTTHHPSHLGLDLE